MSQELINVGEAPNDGAGDPLRVAFIKTNNNFSTLFATGGITGIANGTSNLQIPTANGAIRMAVANVANVVVVTSGGMNVTGNTAVTGTATLGNAAISGTVVANGTIQSLGAVTAVTVTASGNLVGGNLNIINQVRTSDLLVTGNIINAELNVTGNLVANKLTSLGGITAAGFNTANGEISATGANLTISGFSAVNGNITGTGSLLSITGFSANSGRLTVSGNANVAGNIIAPFFIGNGSQLTGVTAAPANIFNIVSANGTLVIATSPNDTLQMSVGNNMTLLGNATTRAVAIGFVESPTFTGTVTSVAFVGDLKGTVVADDSSIMVDAVNNKLYGSEVIANGNISGTNFTATGNANVTGNITGNYVIGNGAFLTGVTSYSNANAVAYGEAGWAGNIKPSANITYDLGNSTQRWKDIWLANSTIYLGNTTLSANSVTSNLILGNVEATGLSSTANIAAPYFIGNVLGNISGNLTVAGGNTQVVFNDSGTANATAGFTFDKATNAVSVAGNVSAANISTAGILTVTGNATITGNVSGNYILGNGACLTGVITSVANINNGTSKVEIAAANANVAVTVANTANVAVFSSTQLAVTGNITATGNASVLNLNTTADANVQNALIQNILYLNFAGNATAIINSAGNGVGNIGSSGNRFNTVFAKATSAEYADLAEKYLADAAYAPGTVVSFGGSAEITQSSTVEDTRIAGVVSTNPAYTMNDGLQGDHVVSVALAGRVPCKVTGPVQAGDMMVSDGLGGARACNLPKIGSVLGKAIVGSNDLQGVIEIVVGRI